MIGIAHRARPHEEVGGAGERVRGDINGQCADERKPQADEERRALRGLQCCGRYEEEKRHETAGNSGMVVRVKIETRELSTSDWPAVERLFGTNGACAGCWRMFWRLPAAFAYTGVPSLFEKAGFTLAGARTQGKQRYRLALGGSDPAAKVAVKKEGSAEARTQIGARQAV